MHIFFWWDYYLTNFLFYGYTISSIIILVGTCSGLLGLSLFFEWLKMLQAKVRQERILFTQQQMNSTIICPGTGESATLLTNNSEPEPSTSSTSMPNSNLNTKPSQFILKRKHTILHFMNDVGLWIIQNILGYILMLVIMVYNGYMVIAIVIGSAIGYFIFGPTLIQVNIENCRAIRGTFCMANCTEPDKTTLLGTNNIIDSELTGESSPICHQTTENENTNVITSSITQIQSTNDTEITVQVQHTI